MIVLKSRLYDAEMQKQNNETGTARKSMIDQAIVQKK